MVGNRTAQRRLKGNFLIANVIQEPTNQALSESCQPSEMLK